MFSVFILGAAGFIGSNLAEKFIKSGYKVIALDGFLDQTGGSKKHIDTIIDQIDFIDQRIEYVDDLPELVKSVDIIVDCMAWTSHHSAINNPIHDLELNAGSHLALLTKIPKNSNQKFIYLGSRGQYGNPNEDLIDENTPLIPEDIQGIHKLAAESYYRVYSKLKNINVVSLRFPNCFGRNQPISRSDIGLIGSFIKDALAENVIDIYGEGRRRNIIYVDDLVNVIGELVKRNLTGFNAYNINGFNVSIYELAKQIVSVVGKGTVSVKKMPGEIEAIDIGNAEFSDEKIRNLIGEIPKTELKKAISDTVDYFRRYLS